MQSGWEVGREVVGWGEGAEGGMGGGGSRVGRDENLSWVPGQIHRLSLEQTDPSGLTE